MVSIYALGPVSGANFNPAVSLTLLLTGNMDVVKFAYYSVTQITAGIAAGLSYTMLFGKAFNLAPGAGHNGMTAGAVEILYTFMLCFVVVAGGYAAGGISGGAFNPAVAIGIDVASAGLGFGWGFAYAGYELIGAALASAMFRVVRPDEFGGEADYSLGTKLVSEFIGTFYLVLQLGSMFLAKAQLQCGR